MSWILLGLTVLVLAVVVLRWPRWTVVLLGVAAALELLSQYYPQIGAGSDGVSLITLTRLVSVAVIAAGGREFIRHMRERNMPTIRFRARMIFVSPLMLVILGYWVYGACGFLYTADIHVTMMELLRLGMLIGVLVAAAYMLEKEDIVRVLSAVHIVGLVLAVVAFAEKVVGWSGPLIGPDGEVLAGTQRIHTTFIDANIFARYLVLAIAANLVLQKLNPAKRWRGFFWLGMPVLLTALVLTESRGGVLTLAAVLVLALIFLPRRKQMALFLGGLSMGGALLVRLTPSLWERVTGISTLMTDSGSVRRYLVEVALTIFGDHKVFGTGLGTFAKVFVESYSEEYSRFLDEGSAVRSHTSVLTIAAEQGIVGLVFLAALLAVLLCIVIRLHSKRGHSNLSSSQTDSFVLGSGCLLWVAAVFVSSQAEGRFFEDPMLWLAMGMLMVLSRERVMTY